MNKGDTLTIQLDYTVDGEPITEGQFDQIEFSIGDKRYTLTDGDITWDGESSMYALTIGQADTFDLGGKTEYQLRLKSGTSVVSSGIGTLTLGKTISTSTI